MPKHRSIYSPLGIRVLGVVLVAQGIATIIYGHRAPRWHMAFVRWGAKRNGEHRLRAVR